MKKILSTLVMCLILGVSSVWAHTVNLYARVEGRPGENAGGQVMIKGAKAEQFGPWIYYTWPTDWASNGYTATAQPNEETGMVSGSAKFMVNIGTVDHGYYFVSWAKDQAGNVSADFVNNTEIEIPKQGNNNGTFNYYAIFKPVVLNSVSITADQKDGTTTTTTGSGSITTAGIGGTGTATIEFNITGQDVDVEDFIITSSIPDEFFKITSGPTYTNDKVTYKIQFKDNNKHGDMTPAATITLISKGDGSTQTATITATSDLTPRTTITPSPCDLTPSSPVLAGNTVSATLNVAAAKGYTTVVDAATITAVEFTNPEDAELKGYTLDATNPKAPVVSFTPTEFSINQANVETEICVTTVYTDANDKVITHTECVTITADAGKIITIGGVKDAVMDFGIIDYTETNVPVQMEYPIYSTLAATDFTPTESGFTADISKSITFVGSGATTDNVVVTANSTPVPNDYTATLTYTEENGADPISASLTVKVSIKLAKPVVTATVLDGNVTLTWPAVYGANRYIIKSEGVEIATVTATTYKVTNIGGQELTPGRQYPFTVTAVYDANPEKGNRESDIVYATPGIPTVITYGDIDDINMYTGTEWGAGDGGVYESFPYSKKRKIQLNRIFDGTTHEPLFDELYIFGLTTETDGTHEKINLPSASLGCNATTPLYVYTKSGNEYVKTAEYDAVEKRFNFILEMGETTDNPDDHPRKDNQHLYFTGYCPFAYMGTKSTEEGWMYFKGAKNATVDIYLDNCQIMGRYKTPSGANSGYNEYELILEADASKLGGTQANESFLQGNSSVFLFTSTSTNSTQPYKPTFHIAGNNHLKGQLGSYITRTTGRVTILFVPITMDAGIGKIYTYSAPIAIKPQDLSSYTNLTLTDIWKDNSITNGYLRLDAEKAGSPSEKVVSIDLGSANGSLTINGGQYHLRNSAADGTYACNLAVGYRLFSKLVEKAGQKLLLHLYGFGGDMTDCKVTINSGTFTMYKNMYPNGTDALGNPLYLGDGYYRDQAKFLDLRLPAGNGASCINGGTFNGITNVCMCTQVTTTGASPKNSAGYWLRLVDVPKTGTTSYSSTEFQIPVEYVNEGYYDSGNPIYDITGDNLSKVAGGSSSYGGQSANAYRKNDADVVTLLLPGNICEPTCREQKEALIYQWATAIPRFDATKTVSGVEQSVQVGGSIYVKNSPEEGSTALDSITNQLLFLDAKGMEPYSMNLVAQGAKLSFNDASMPRGKITNPKEYTIEENLNMLKVVQADTWYTFTAPYDVHQISVIEVSESQVSAKPTKAEAVAQQAQNNLQVFYKMQDFILPNAQGRTSSLTLPQLLPSGTKLIPITHYDGTNIMSANYYLYELTNEEFTTDGTGTELDIAWQPVSRTAEEPLMYKGEVYAIQFPWCPMCNDLASRTYYDYWSNKMILFYGKGPQTIAGTNLHNTIVSDSMPTLGATATLEGNSTFADMTLTAQTAYVHNTATDIFELNNAQYVVKPTEGFLLYNPGAKPMPARISRSGQIEYRDNTATGMNGVPTVGDRTTLMVMDAYDGFEILSLSDQRVAVYNLQGNVVFQSQMAEGEQVHVSAAEGVYVVVGEHETIKLMVD